MPISNLEFLHPYFFLLLLLIPWVFKLLFLKKRQGVVISHMGKTSSFSSFKPMLSFIGDVFKILSLIGLIVAMSQPQIIKRDTVTNSEGVGIFLALDTSGSMRALDFQLNEESVDRLVVIKKVVADFITQRVNDKIGIIPFGTEAFTLCPLTADKEAVQSYARLLEIGMAGEETAIGHALALGVKAFSQVNLPSKVIVLLTDGENNSGSVTPMTIADVAKEQNIKIHTIAVGRDGYVPMPVQTAFGTRIQNVESHVDRELLRRIADITGGFYFEADDTEGLKGIYKRIDELEKAKVESWDRVEVTELAFDIIKVSLMLLVLSFLIQSTVAVRLT